MASSTPTSEQQVPPPPPAKDEPEKKEKSKSGRPARSSGKPKRYGDDSDSDYEYRYDKDDEEDQDDDEYHYRKDDDEEVYGVKLKIKNRLAAKPKIAKPARKPKAPARGRQRMGPGGIPLPNLPPLHQQTIMGARIAHTNSVRLTTDQELQYMARMHARYGDAGACQAIRNLGGIA